MASRIRIKRGDPFSVSCVRRDAEGSPVDLSGATVISQVRATGFEDDLSVVVDNAAGGEYDVSRDGAGTLNWPLGIIFWDVRYVGGLAPGSSDTVEILVLEDVTRAP